MITEYTTKAMLDKFEKTGEAPCQLDLLNFAQVMWEKVDAYNSWASANLDELECRGDDDCDHCVLKAILDNKRETDDS